MTTDELMALKGKAKSAPGLPWSRHDTCTLNGIMSGEPPTTRAYLTGADKAKRICCNNKLPGNEAILDYIVAACNAVPGLVDEVMRLRGMQERCAMLAEDRITKDEDFIEYDDGQCANDVACKMIAAAIRSLK